MIRFMVPGNPIPKARPRVVNGHTYTPRETTDAETRIKVHAKNAKVRVTDKPVHLAVRFYRETAHACDLDNLVKTVSDALNGIAYRDDRQVAWLVASKEVDREFPRTEIEIWGADELRDRPNIDDDIAKGMA